MYGGGAITGFEFEYKIFNRISIQHGFGYNEQTHRTDFNMGLLYLGSSFVSFGAGLNYHLKNSLRSSYISFQYWQQGAIFDFIQNAAGPVFVYRGKKWFTAQIGLGYVLVRNQETENKSPLMVTYAVGFYLID
jgi:hypothetical protein